MTSNLACVQTSPLSQEKSGEETSSPLPIFPEGGGTSVHRLLRTYVGVIYAFTIFIYSICAQTKNIEHSVCKNARRVGGEENMEHCGRTIYSALEGGGERGCMYY